VITGQRRVGKSYFMKQIMQYIAEKSPDTQIMYINKEDFAFDHIKNYTDLIQYVETQSKAKSVALFIDEIQEIDSFEKGMRHLLLQQKYDLYCTGSNANMLSGDLATLLSGRSVEMQIYALSYPEFLTFHNLKDTNDNFEKYMIYGGMPNLIHLEMTDEVVFEYLQNIYNTIIVRDVIERHNIRNTAFLRNLSRFLADNTGSLVSAKRISDFLKSQKINISSVVVSEYLSFLSDAYFIAKVRRMDLQGRKIFELNEKYYFNDVGLRNSLIGYKVTDKGKILENIVFNHLKIAGYNVYVGHDRNKEVDFVAEKNNDLLYIQVALRLDTQNTVDREFGNLLRIKNAYPKYVVSMDESSLTTYEGVRHINIREFCNMMLK